MFYPLSSCYIHTNELIFCKKKSKEKGLILTAVKTLAGTKFWTCDLLTQFFKSSSTFLTEFGRLNYNWQILTMVIGNRKEEVRVCNILSFILLEKAQRPARIDYQQFWTEKSQASPSRESNPACSDRMPLLYHLRHRHGLPTPLLH